MHTPQQLEPRVIFLFRDTPTRALTRTPDAQRAGPSVGQEFLDKFAAAGGMD